MAPRVSKKAPSAEAAKADLAGVKKAQEENFAAKISKMLGKLKYTRDHSKSATETEKEDCHVKHYRNATAGTACMITILHTPAYPPHAHICRRACMRYAHFFAASQEAASALTMYHSLAETGHREHFIKQFEAGGSGKGKDALKFVLNFKQTLQQHDTKSVAVGRVSDSQY